MTPFEAKGWKATDKFRVFNRKRAIFSAGDVVELDRDDGTCCPFFKRTRDGIVSAYYLDDLERIEPQWNGEGLPPVGTVCEFKCTDTWIRGKVKYKSDKFVILNTDTNAGEMVFDPCSLQFRPIRTDREKGIEEMLDLLNAGTQLSLTDAIEQLYDAGYRKQ